MDSPLNNTFNQKATVADIRAFIHAAEQGDKERVAEALKRFGRDFANASDHGTTALMLAAFRDQTGVMELLIENGANLEARNRDDDTALIWALYAERPAAALLLLDYGADVNVVNKMGKTPFDYAEKLSRPDIIHCMKTATPRNIERTIENGVQNPLPVRRPLKLRKG